MPRLQPPQRSRAAIPVLLLVAAAVACDEPEARIPLDPTGGAVAAGTPAATAIGQEILVRGGNAADAAVAVSLALAVSEPGQSGLGGSAVAMVRAPGADPVVIHVPPTALGRDGELERTGGTVIVPALLPVLERLWRNHGSGTLEWEELVAPALRLAEEGFPLGRLAHRTLVREYARLLADELLSDLFLTENRAIHAEGSVLTRPALAATLRTLGQQGPADLYRGGLANQLVAWAQESGFPLERSHLAGAPPAEEVPASRGSYGAWTVWVPPEPFAGEAVLRGLSVLSRAPAGLPDASPMVYAPWTTEALAWAFGEGGMSVDVHLASVPALPRPTPDTTGVRRGAGDRPTGSGGAPAGPGGSAGSAVPRPTPSGEGETTHFSIIDGEGGIVSLTQTLGAPYGAAIPAGNLGFVLGLMGAESPTEMPGWAGAGSGEGDGQGEGDEGEAGPTTPSATTRWLTPVIVTRSDSMEIALGSPGGPRGVSAIVQVIARGVWDPVNLQQTVSRPRIHVGPGPDGLRGRVYLEGLRFEPSDSIALTRGVWSDSTRAALGGRGFLVTERDTGLYFQGVSPWFGGVNAVARIGSEFYAASDPRRDGTARRADESYPLSGGVNAGTGGEERRPPLP